MHFSSDSFPIVRVEHKENLYFLLEAVILLTSQFPVQK